jgi:demethylmenaquinone methyltransferase/2-methoxy-6-polyprenyl-1,4-benzoquinol methylase
VSFAIADAYAPAKDDKKYSAAFAGLWISHVDKARMREFLVNFHRRLKPGATVLLFDQQPAPWESKAQKAENRLEARVLDSGERFRIIKNHFTKRELQKLLEPFARDIEFTDGIQIFSVNYKVK